MTPPMKATRDDRDQDALQHLARKLRIQPAQIGVIIVDHGSRRDESNQVLLEIVQLFRAGSPFAIVEPAHMVLAEPSLATAFRRCVRRQARLIVVHPYFLLPGRHWGEDIPALAAAAAEECGHIPYLVTAPLGLHPLMAEVIEVRVEQCLRSASGSEPDGPTPPS